MNLQTFDLNLLLVFRALFEEKNVTKASKKVGITQPAMSNALNRLRYLVNDELFVRGPKGMRPTARAIELSIPIQEALNNIEISLSAILIFAKNLFYFFFTIKEKKFIIISKFIFIFRNKNIFT